LRERLQAGLAPALRAGDAARVSVLRTTLAAVANAEAVDASGARPASGAFAGEVPRRQLSEDDVRAVVVAARDELRTAEAELRTVGQADAAADLAARAAVLDAYLAP
jgi:hypothetical protein